MRGELDLSTISLIYMGLYRLTETKPESSLKARFEKRRNANYMCHNENMVTAKKTISQFSYITIHRQLKSVQRRNI